jgi:hypothetical protein
MLALLLGITALLTLLSVRQLPLRVKCPRCGKLRVVRRHQCEHCAAAFDPPRPEGIEIFEPALATG